MSIAHGSEGGGARIQRMTSVHTLCILCTYARGGDLLLREGQWFAI